MYVHPVNASTTFSELLTGTPGQIWNPSFFVFVGGDEAVYNPSGVIGTSNGDNFYKYTTSNLDNIIKWNVTLNGNYKGLISCRDSNDVSSEERAAFNGDGTVNLQWYYNGGGTNGPGTSIPTSGIHEYELDCVGNTMTLKQDGSVILTSVTNWDVTQNMQMIRLDLNDTNTTLTSYQLCDSNGCTPSSSLSVPLLKQTDSPWSTQEYDSAHIWSPANQTIADWGCAVTSAAMVFQYHGITKMPDGSQLDPGSLNTWLKSQPDGYIGNGNVNWLALQRLSLLAKQSGNNPGFAFDALQYQVVTGGNSDENNATLTNDLQTSPDILEEPGHFVVATGTQSGTFAINDPYYSRATLNDGYGNSYLTLDRFIPSHTDLSYIMIDAPQGVAVNVTDSQGNPVGQHIIQAPLEDDQNPGTFAGDNESIFYLPQPQDTQYNLTVLGQDGLSYTLKLYAYDTQGNVKVLTSSGVVNNTTPETLTLNYSKTNLQADSFASSVTFDSVLKDIQDLYNQNQLKKDVYRNLLNETKEAQRAYKKNHFHFIAKLELAEQLLYLKFHKGKGVSSTAYTILSKDFTDLIKSL